MGDWRVRFRDTRRKISIFLNKRDRTGTRYTYKVLVEKFLEMGVSGATVFGSRMSYGSSFEMHSPTSELPFLRNRGVMIVVIETERKAREVLSLVERLVPNGVVTVEKVEFIRFTETKVSDKDRNIVSDASVRSLGTGLTEEPEKN